MSVRLYYMDSKVLHTIGVKFREIIEYIPGHIVAYSYCNHLVRVFDYIKLL